jgi:hypothetical protein
MLGKLPLHREQATPKIRHSNTWFELTDSKPLKNKMDCQTRKADLENT